jgi:hypothetical protein
MTDHTYQHKWLPLRGSAKRRTRNSRPVVHLVHPITDETLCSAENSTKRKWNEASTPSRLPVDYNLCPNCERLRSAERRGTWTPPQLGRMVEAATEE